MEIRYFLRTVKRRFGTIFLITVIFLVAAGAYTFAQPLKYGADSKLLVVQNFGGSLDSYTASKSNEFLAGILANVTASEYFFRDVMASGFNIDETYFPERADKKMKMWRETVSARAVNDTGIIALSVYHTDKQQLEQIARAVNFVLQTKNGQYHNGGDKVSVKIIDEPVISNLPAKPNIIMNFAMSLVLGILFGMSYVYIFAEERYEIRPNIRPSQDYDDEYEAYERALAKARDVYDYEPKRHGENHRQDDRRERDVRERGDMRNILD